MSIQTFTFVVINVVLNLKEVVYTPKSKKFEKMEKAMKKTYGVKKGKNIAYATAKKRGMKY